MPQPADPADLPMAGTQPTPAGWYDDPQVLSWDWREQPDLGRLAALLARHGVRLEEVDTGSDQYAIRVTGPDRDGANRLLEPRGWSSAADALRDRACVIESGVLTPWADQPEPPTLPAEAAQGVPAAAGPHPGTLDGPGVLGRALLHESPFGLNAWVEQDGMWHSHTASIARTRTNLESRLEGPVREVLLVSPAAVRVLDAAREWRAAFGAGPPGMTRSAALMSAVDALDGDQPAGPDPAEREAEAIPEPAVVRLAEGVHWLGEAVGDQPPQPDDSHSLTDHARLPTGPAPEPAVGCLLTTDNDMQAFAELPDCSACEGTGKDLPPDWRTQPAEPVQATGRDRIGARVVDGGRPGTVVRCPECGSGTLHHPDELPELVEADDGEPALEPDRGPGWDREAVAGIIAVCDRAGEHESAFRLRALLADRDRWERLAGAAEPERKAAWMAAADAGKERDAARAELAEAQAERAEARRLAKTATVERDLADQQARWNREAYEQTVAELATARRDAAADAVAAALERAAAEMPDAPDSARQWLLSCAEAARTAWGTRPVPGSPQPANEGGGDDGA